MASKRDWDALKRDVKPIYTAVNATAARAAFEDMAETWGSRYGAIVRLWENGGLTLMSTSVAALGAVRRG